VYVARIRDKSKTMGRAYSDDLRRKLLQAHDRGDGSLRELAQRFGVSAPYAWKISSQRRRSGQMDGWSSGTGRAAGLARKCKRDCATCCGTSRT